MSVSPGWACNWCKHVLRLDAREVPELILKYPLLNRELHRGIHVLHAASATDPKIRTLGRDSPT